MGDLKGELLKFATSRQFRPWARAAQAEFLRRRKKDWDEERDFIDFVNEFATTYRLPNGKTMCEMFADSYPLSEKERRIIRGWSNAFIAILEVLDWLPERDGWRCRNLINDKEYTIRPNIDAESLPINVGAFVVTSIVSYGDFHSFAGQQQLHSPEERSLVEQVVRDTRRANPRLYLVDNEEAIRRSFELQAEDHDDFVAFFGDDEIVGEGPEVGRKYAEFRRWQSTEKRDADGLTRAEKYERAHGRPLDLPDFGVFNKPPFDKKDIGLVYDKIWGQSVLVGYGKFLDLLRHPSEKAVRLNRRLLKTYIESEHVEPFVLRKAAERYPDGFKFICKELYRFPRFDLSEDLERLLRKHKAKMLDRQPSPTMSVADPLFLDGIAEQRAQTDRSR